jgi:ligand-binding sensor domain-containing protein
MIMAMAALYVCSVVPAGGYAYAWQHYVAITDVNRIVQQQDTLWIATDVGLAAFTRSDSTYRFFDHVNSDLPCPRIEAIAVDTGGVKWLGTKKGLIRFDGTTFDLFDHTNSEIPSDASSFTIKSIMVDARNTKWIGSWNGGLVMMTDTGSRVFTRHNSALPGNAITSLARDSSDNILIGTYSGYGVLRAPGYETIDTSLHTALPADPVWSIVTSPDGSVWLNAAQCFVTCGEGGLVHDSAGTISVYDADQLSVLANKVNSMCFSRDGTLWLGTNDGIGTYAQGQWDVAGLSDVYIYDIFEDNDGTMWCATSNGFYARRGTTWRLHTYSSSGIPGNAVWDVLGDSRGNVWLGMPDGLYTFNGGSFVQVDDSVLDGKGVSCLYEDPHGTIWARAQYSVGYSTYYSLVRTTATGWEEFDLAATGLSSDADAQDVLVQEDGTLWIATNRGVASGSNGNWTVYDTANSTLPHANVRALARDAAGNIWLGGGNYRYDGNGLVQIIDGQWLVHTGNIGLAVDNVYAIETDDRGHVWVGGSTSPSFNKGGLTHFDGYSWVDTMYIGSNTRVTDIALGGDGSMWAGVYNSVINTDLSTCLVEHTDGTITTYGPHNSPFLGESINALDFDASGRQWVATAGAGLFMRETGISGRLRQSTNRKAGTGTCGLYRQENGAVRVTWYAGAPARVRIAAYTPAGRVRAVLHAGTCGPGQHERLFSARSIAQHVQTAGAYVLVLHVGVQRVSKLFCTW